MRPKRCETCEAWTIYPDRNGDGQCRRMSPMMLWEGEKDDCPHVGIWPETDPDDWCLEWQPKEDAT
jgi:hypothetical protein